ncbi:MAG: beta-lactamase family protein [Candidatus Protochlamydia sp.]|nr:beta-lactamase family protein [Candidatus Protochlamydia sp.]
MKQRKFLASIFIFLLLATGCSLSNSDTIESKRPAQSIEELKQKLEIVLKDTHTPGLSVAIVHREGVEWVAGLGKADVVSGQPVTAETLFRIGSVSKAFTSLAVLQLTEQGKLSLEEPVQNLTPEVWFENRWETDHPVRLVHLLEHTTGWDDMHFREYAINAPTISLVDAFNYDHSSRYSRWQPGTRMAYCNSGPAVAAYIVEKLTGAKFEDYVEKHLFRPMGMKTATYFQSQSGTAATLYHSDGKTPFTYWDFIYRPSGSINASANDMANYLHFYLNRGKVNGIQVLKDANLDRMESPSSTWAAKEGLKTGYGLCNYQTIHDGFVYHGHDGMVDGGLTVMAYLPDEGSGYFYSINSANTEALNKIGTLIRGYLTRNMQKPPVPSSAPLSEHAAGYAGWYRRDSPRLHLTYFLERLLGIAYIHFEEGKLLMTSIGENNATYLPVNESQFRYVSKIEPAEPVPTVALLKPNVEGQFIQSGLGMSTLKRIPTWLAIYEITTLGFVGLSLLSVLLYAPFWIFSGLNKKWRRPAERSMRIWPLIATLSLMVMTLISLLSIEDFISRLGNPTGWSFSFFLATIIFAAASLASAIALWRTPKQELRPVIRFYTFTVTVALVTTSLYLAYWGIIGLQTWA